MGLYGYTAHKLMESKVGNQNLDNDFPLPSAGHPNGQEPLVSKDVDDNNEKQDREKHQQMIDDYNKKEEEKNQEQYKKDNNIQTVGDKINQTKS